MELELELDRTESWGEGGGWAVFWIDAVNWGWVARLVSCLC